MAHAAAGGVSHLAILQMIARLRKQIVIAASAAMPSAPSPSRTGLIISRWRFLPMVSSKPVSITIAPDGPTMAQTKKSSGCRISCGSPSMKLAGERRE
jgi:hypothetical protein